MLVPAGIDRKAAEVEAAASKDSARPALTEPWLVGSNLYATDSYVAVRIPVELDPGDTDGTVPGAALKAARKPRAMPNVLLNGSAVTSEGDGRAEFSRRVHKDQLPPAIDALIPDADALEGATSITVNILKLAQAAKAIGCDVVTLTIRDADKPIVMQPNVGSDGRIALVMPVRKAR